MTAGRSAEVEQEIDGRSEKIKILKSEGATVKDELKQDRQNAT